MVFLHLCILAVGAERVKEAEAAPGCYRGDGADDASMLGCRDFRVRHKMTTSAVYGWSTVETPAGRAGGHTPNVVRSVVHNEYIQHDVVLPSLSRRRQ